MSELQIFNNPEFGEIRTLEINGEPWFAGKDAAIALGYKNPRQALATNVDEEDKGVHRMDTPSGIQEMIIINESGLYSLILSSKLPTAKKFKRWVTREVLPTIRKHGTYTAPGKSRIPEGISLGGLARLLSVTRRIMIDMGSSPVEIGAVARGLYETCGIPLHEAFSNQIPGQLSLFEHDGEVRS